MRRLGNNQYRTYRRPKDHRINNIGTILWLLAITSIIVWIGLLYRTIDHPVHILSPLSLNQNVYAEEIKLTPPPLAPMSEREHNIALVRRYFGKDADDAIKVFTCESGLRSAAENDHNSDGLPDVGIAQIHVYPSDPFTVQDMKDPIANLAEAKHKFDTRGWQPWVSSSKCWGGSI